MLHARLAVRQTTRRVRLTPLLSVRGIPYYRELLGVGPDASTEELKKAFYSKSRVYHPDLAQGDKAKNDKYIEIKEAYEELLKAKKSGSVAEAVRQTKGKKFGARKFRSEGNVSENYFDHVPQVKVKTPLGFGRGNAKKSFQTRTFKSSKDEFVEETIQKYRKK